MFKNPVIAVAIYAGRCVCVARRAQLPVPTPTVFLHTLLVA